MAAQREIELVFELWDEGGGNVYAPYPAGLRTQGEDIYGAAGDALDAPALCDLHP